jgi:two-component system response regulator YesN
MNILLVDDDEVIRLGMRKVIDKADRDWHVCGEVSDGAMALDFLSGNRDVDLIICDVRMPIMDGLELIEILGNRDEIKTKIIMLSGYNDFEYVRSAFMNGACDYILKPFKKEELIALIEKIELQISDEKCSKQTHDENNDFLITELLRRLSTSSEKEAPGYLKRLRDLNLCAERRYCAVIYIEADQYYRQFLQKAQYSKALSGIYREAVMIGRGSKSLDIISTLDDQYIIFLVFSDSVSEITEYARKLFEELNKESDSDQSVTVGISDISDKMNAFSSLFRQSKDAAMGRFYLGQKQLIKYNDIEDKVIEIHYDQGPAVKELVHWITMCDYMKSKEIMDRVFLDLSYCRENVFRNHIHEIVDQLCAKAEAFADYYNANAQEINFCIDYLNTYRELKTYMSYILKNSIEYIKNEKEKRSGRRIEMAKEYISTHYSESFTLSDLADYVELNASYFSNLFKNETGVNFSEYVMNVRMDKAKELLKDPKIKIYEIGNLVGYEDAVSFGRAFKKKWGISPKEYRNSVY